MVRYIAKHATTEVSCIQIAILVMEEDKPQKPSARPAHTVTEKDILAKDNLHPMKTELLPQPKVIKIYSQAKRKRMFMSRRKETDNTKWQN